MAWSRYSLRARASASSTKTSTEPPSSMLPVSVSSAWAGSMRVSVKAALETYAFGVPRSSLGSVCAL